MPLGEQSKRFLIMRPVRCTIRRGTPQTYPFGSSGNPEHEAKSLRGWGGGGMVVMKQGNRKLDPGTTFFSDSILLSP